MHPSSPSGVMSVRASVRPSVRPCTPFLVHFWNPEPDLSKLNVKIRGSKNGHFCDIWPISKSEIWPIWDVTINYTHRRASSRLPLCGLLSSTCCRISDTMFFWVISPITVQFVRFCNLTNHPPNSTNSWLSFLQIPTKISFPTCSAPPENWWIEKFHCMGGYNDVPPVLLQSS